MGRINQKNNSQALEALVRPNSLDVVGQQTELYPFDAFEFTTFDEDSGRPILTLKEPWRISPDTLPKYELDPKSFTVGSFTHIDGGTSIDGSDERIFDGDEFLSKASVDEVYNDTTSSDFDSEDNERGTIVFEDGLLIRGPIKVKDGYIQSVDWTEEGETGSGLKVDLENAIIQSGDFVSGSNGSGWKIDGNGDVEFNSGTFRGELEAASGSFFSTDGSTGLEIKNGNISFTDSNIFGGTNKAAIGQGSLGNLIMEGDNYVILSVPTDNRSLQFAGAGVFNRFYPTDNTDLGSTFSPWGAIYFGNNFEYGGSRNTSYGVLTSITFISSTSEDEIYEFFDQYMYNGQKVATMGSLDGQAVGYVALLSDRVSFSSNEVDLIASAFKDETSDFNYNGTIAILT